MIRSRNLRSYLSHIFYVHTEAGGAVAFLFAAALELSCGAALGWDNPIAILAWYAAFIRSMGMEHDRTGDRIAWLSNALSYSELNNMMRELVS